MIKINRKFNTNKNIEEYFKIKNLNVCFDSRKLKENDIFLALNGTSQKGSKYILEAISKKVCLILTDDVLSDDLIKEIEKYDVPIFEIIDLRKDMGKIFKNYYNLNLNKIDVIGITGTNGKTTCSYILDEVLENTSRIGTNNYNIAGRIITSTNTTPESVELVKFLKESIDKKVSSFIMEVSSHSLVMNRVNFLKFNYAIFTNLSQDHLDYHKTMEEYFKAKKKIFNMIKENGMIIVNKDNEYTKTLKYEFKNDKYKIIDFSTEDENVDFYGKILEYNNTGMKVLIKNRNNEYIFNTKLIGKHNLENLLATFPILLKKEKNIEKLIKKLEEVKVDGRCELIKNDKEITVVVDYAHTDDGIKNITKTLSEIKKGKLITVFGAGGNRDKTKRPKMGVASSIYSDYVILTSDNPRNENPLDIINDIKIAVTKPYEIIEDRKLAIRKALSIANKNDIVLILGKGHETYQIVGDEVFHFSDKEEVEKYFNGI